MFFHNSVRLVSVCPYMLRLFRKSASLRPSRLRSCAAAGGSGVEIFPDRSGRILTEKEAMFLKMDEDYNELNEKVLNNAPKLHEDKSFRKKWETLYKYLINN